MDNYALSVEELALAMSMVGQPKMAHDLMLAQLGKMEQEEARLRLMTASHSLLARSWLSLDAQGVARLADGLARVARLLTRADFSIRYNRSHPNADFSFSFHFGEGKIFAHRVEQGVVHRIAEVADTGAVVQGGVEFLEVAQARPFTCSPAGIPRNLLSELKGGETLSAALKGLEQAGVPEDTRKLLVEDLQGTQYRGSVLRVEYGQDNLPRSENGLLMLRGPERLWLLRARNGHPTVEILPASEGVFRREVVSLLGKKIL